jgi:hypothetical protein
MALADWDARLIAPEAALRMAGDWPVYYTLELAELSEYLSGQQDQWQINERCGKCHQSTGMLAYREAGMIETTPLDPPLTGPQTTIADRLSGVLRHMVTAHDWSLSGASHG